MTVLIKNGHVVDPLTKKDGVYDVLVEGKKIQKIAEKIDEKADRVIDARGTYVLPGFIDLHVHLRDPGLEYKETLETGGRAAVHGGVTTICAMPNTKPVIDSREKVEAVHERAVKESPAHVIQLGAVTCGQEGKELADIAGMAAAGCHAISEDGKSVMNASLYRKGMKETGVRLHLCHCSTKDSVTMVEMAKKEGLPVTAEVCPHHFILTSDDIKEDDGNFKMNPPLRSREDVEALRMGLKNGIMDVISTDHAPHSEEEKNRSIEKASFGIVGLETSAALTYTELVKTGVLSIMDMAEKMSYNPAQILGLTEKGAVAEGKIADLVIFDPDANYKIDKNTFFSKGKNTPFDGREVYGRVEYTLADGEIVYEYQDTRKV